MKKYPRRVVVITDPKDAHIPFVQKHLDEPLIILDSAAIVQGRTLTYALQEHRFEVVQDNRTLQDIRGVWYRRPTEFVAPNLQDVPEHLRIYATKAINRFGTYLRTRFEDARWVSDPYAIFRASDKLLQLEIAKRIGFAIPDTVVTSSPAAALDFVSRHEAAITKPLEVTFIKDEGGSMRVFFASKINKAQMDFSGLHLAPAIFQQAIDVDVDIRVSVVGDAVFAATIKGSMVDESSSLVRDWRIANHKGDIKIEAFDLPRKLSDLCISHVKELGLAFGGIDLILDKQGKFWFIENNPNGQWAFVEMATGQPIGKAIAGLLMQSKK